MLCECGAEVRRATGECRSRSAPRALASPRPTRSLPLLSHYLSIDVSSYITTISQDKTTVNVENFVFHVILAK